MPQCKVCLIMLRFHSTGRKINDEVDLNKVYLGLGGNVGDVKAVLMAALDALNKHPNISVKQLSNLYETPPWGDENQDWFLNACALIETSIQPLELLKFVKSLEVEFKREKSRKWGPRTLDIDLLVYEGVALKSETLTLPHPRISERAFVLVPLNDLAPNLLVNGKSVSKHLQLVDCDEINLVGEGGAY